MEENTTSPDNSSVVQGTHYTESCNQEDYDVDTENNPPLLENGLRYIYTHQEDVGE